MLEEQVLAEVCPRLPRVGLAKVWAFPETGSEKIESRRQL